MKKFRLLAVLALAVVMLFTVVAAAEVEYNGTDDTITVNLVAPGSYTIDQASSIFMSYDNAIFSVNSMSSPAYAAATLKDEGNAVSWCCDNSAVTVVEGETVILTVVFNVVDKAAAVGYEFDTESDLTAVFTDAGDYLMDMGSVVVVAAEVDPVKVPQEAISAQAGTFDIYENVVVLSVDVALDAAAQGYGFDLTNGTKTKTFELGNAVSGDGTLEYVVAFWGVPDGVTITATPWVLK